MKFWKSKQEPRESGAEPGARATQALKSSYVSGREEWLERYGNYIKRERRWQWIAIVCLCITTVAVAGNVIQATQNKIIPYVVEVDNLGQIAAVERAAAPSATPTRVIQAELATFVSNWRTVTADLDLQKRMLERLNYSVAGAAKGQLREWYTANNPFERAKNLLVQVDIKSLPSPVSANSWRVEWTETTRNHSGVQMNQGMFQATLMVQIEPPTTDTAVLRNPGGVFVTSMSSSTILEPKR